MSEVSENDLKRVLVLGAYGGAGRAVARGLVATGLFDVVGGGRDAKKLELLKRSCEGLSVLAVDVRDRDALAEALVHVDLVVNCVGPYLGSGVDVACAAVEARIPYFDIASEQEHYRRLFSLDGACREDGLLVLAGAGAYPGLSGIILEGLLKKFPNAESGEMALITGPHGDPTTGGAQEISGLIELAYELMDLEDGELQRVKPGSQQRFEFPQPFGPRDVMRWPQMEVLSVASQGRLREFRTFAALGGQKLPSRRLLGALGHLKPTPDSRVLALLKRFLGGGGPGKQPAAGDPTTNHGAIVVVVYEKGDAHIATAMVNDVSLATAWLPIYAAKEWAAGRLSQSGVAIPMDVFEPNGVLAELRQEANRDMFAMNGL